MDVQYQYLCRILVDGSDQVNIKEEQTASKIFDIIQKNKLFLRARKMSLVVANYSRRNLVFDVWV